MDYDPRYCPLMKGIIEETVCYDICMVVTDWTTPTRFALKKAVENENATEICINFPKNPDGNNWEGDK